MNSLSSERMMKLMAYADGELEGEELREVERLLQTDNDAMRFVNEVAGLGELVDTGHRESKTARAIETFDTADSVIAAIGREQVVAKPSAISSLAATRANRAKRMTTYGMIAAGLALAASMVMVFRTPGSQMVPIASGPVAAAPSAEPGVEVDVGESAGESVRVFYLSSESSPTTSVVVWVDESGGNGR